MESAFAWIEKIINAILSFIPQLIIVKVTHSGVKYRKGSVVKALRPDNGMPLNMHIKWWHHIPIPTLSRSGVHVYWPLITQYELVPIKRQTTNLVPQYLCTQDGISVGVSGILVYEVCDVVRLLTECFDFEETIRDLALASIKTVITSHTLEHLLNFAQDVDIKLTATLGEILLDYGIKTIRCTLSDLVPCQMVGLWGTLVNVENHGIATSKTA